MNVCVEKFENLARPKSRFFVAVFIILSKESGWCTDLILYALYFYSYRFEPSQRYKKALYSYVQIDTLFRRWLN